MAVILKNNKPRYILVDFEEYEEIQKLRQKLISDTADKVIEDNLEHFWNWENKNPP